MKKFNIGNIIILAFIVGMFAILIVECVNINKNTKISDYEAYLSKYTGAVNQINYVKISDYTMAQKYLANFIFVYQNNNSDAYKLIDEYYKKNVVPNISDFNRKMNIIDSKLFLDAKVEKYTIKYDKKTKYFFVEDAAGNIFVFKEKNIMDYTVYLDATTLDL